MIRLIDRYEIEIVKKTKNHYDSTELKQQIFSSPNLKQLKTVLEQAFTRDYYGNTFLHSDQGWQYQHASYHQFLEVKRIRISISRKGDSLDDDRMESCFWNS